MATECEVQEDGSLVAVGDRDWQMTLFDAAAIRLLGQVADEDTTWDVYEIVHRDGSTRTYAIEVGAGPASRTGPTTGGEA